MDWINNQTSERNEREKARRGRTEENVRSHRDWWTGSVARWGGRGWWALASLGPMALLKIYNRQPFCDGTEGRSIHETPIIIGAPFRKSFDITKLDLHVIQSVKFCPEVGGVAWEADQGGIWSIDLLDVSHSTFFLCQLFCNKIWPPGDFHYAAMGKIGLVYISKILFLIARIWHLCFHLIMHSNTQSHYSFWLFPLSLVTSRILEEIRSTL